MTRVSGNLLIFIPGFHFLLTVLQSANGGIGFVHFSFDGFQFRLQCWINSSMSVIDDIIQLALSTSLTRRWSQSVLFFDSCPWIRRSSAGRDAAGTVVAFLFASRLRSGWRRWRGFSQQHSTAVSRLALALTGLAFDLNRLQSQWVDEQRRPDARTASQSNLRTKKKRSIMKPLDELNVSDDDSQDLWWLHTPIALTRRH